MRRNWTRCALGRRPNARNWRVTTPFLTSPRHRPDGGSVFGRPAARPGPGSGAIVAITGEHLPIELALAPVAAGLAAQRDGATPQKDVSAVHTPELPSTESLRGHVLRMHGSPRFATAARPPDATEGMQSEQNLRGRPRAFGSNSTPQFSQGFFTHFT
jgi:hypothetical protein